MAPKKDLNKFVVATSFSRGDQWLDHLLAIHPLHTETIATKLGDSEATIARVVEISDSGEISDHGENPIFWAVVRGQLQQATEKTPWVVGRLTKVGNAFRLDGLSDTEQDLVTEAMGRLDAA